MENYTEQEQQEICAALGCTIEYYKENYL